jgi:Uma2 family endonuclease
VLSERPCTVINPFVIAEVLTGSTERYDRLDKFFHYRRLPSLHDYLVVDERKPCIEHCARNDDGSWTIREVVPPGCVRLSSGAEIDVAEVYRDRLEA